MKSTGPLPKPKARLSRNILIVQNHQATLLCEATNAFDNALEADRVELESEARQVKALLSREILAFPTAATTPHSRAAKTVANMSPARKSSNKTRTNVASYGHSAERVRQVQQDNDVLVRRLLCTMKKAATAPALSKDHDRHMANVRAASERLRCRKAGEIAKENLWLYNRLCAAKPSATVDRRAQEHSFSTSRKYLENLSAKRQAARTLPPGICGKRPWDDRWHVQQVPKITATAKSQ